MKQITNPVYIIIILILVIIILSITTCNGNRKLAEATNLYEAMQDTLQTYRNKDGEQVAKIAVLETEKVSDFLALQTRDSVIQHLQEEVERYKSRIRSGGSVTVISNETRVNGSTNTTVSAGDTVVKDSIVFIYPRYDFEVNQFDGWVSGCGYANRDSIHLDITTKNRYTVAIGFEKKKVPKRLLRKSVPFVEVTNENPYTETKTLRTYQVSLPKPKRFGIMVGLGYGGYFDPTHLRFGHGITANLILGYQIISIK